MQILPASNSSALDAAIACLRSGGVVAHATETCYGLACDLRNPEAVKKLFRIKNRPSSQTVSALFSSLKEAIQYCQFSERALLVAQKHLPGPLTIVLPILPSAPPLYVTADEVPATHIGIRVSPHPVALALAQGFGSPIATTSANSHGESNPYSAKDITEQLSSLPPDVLIDSGTLPDAPPSTVISMSGDEITVLRQGSLHV
ncbi:MAG: L-threonylcarbamoyladenylate synthase [Candidatus Peribacteraceae bacterium]